MDFTQSMDNGYMIPTSVAVGSGEATDIRCVCDTVEDFRTFLNATGMDLRYEGLVTYEKVNKRLMVYEGNNNWKVVGEGGGDVDTSNFITLAQLSQQLGNYYTKTQTDNKISEEIDKKMSDIIIGNGNIEFRNIVEGEIFEMSVNDSITPPVPNVAYGNIVVSNSSLSVPEKGSVDFTIKLDSAPTNAQTVNVSIDNTYCTVDKHNLVFTSNNYNVEQVITVSGVHNNTSYDDKVSVITVSSVNVLSKNVTVLVENIDIEEENKETVNGTTVTRGLWASWDLSNPTQDSFTQFLDLSGNNVIMKGTSICHTEVDGGVQLNKAGVNTSTVFPSSTEYTSIVKVKWQSKGLGIGGMLNDTVITNNDTNVIFGTINGPINLGDTDVIALTVNTSDSRVRLYKNGELIGEDTKSTLKSDKIWLLSNSTSFGKNIGYKMMVYDVELTSEEIRTISEEIGGGVNA